MLHKKIFCAFSLFFLHATYASETVSDKNSLLAIAIQHNNISSIISLIQDDTVDINITDPLGASALSRLCDDAVMTRTWLASLIEITSPNNNIETEDDIYSEQKNMLKQIHIKTKAIAQQQYNETLNAINFLIEKGSNPNIVLQYTWNPHPERTLPFLFAIIHNDSQEKEKQLDINIQNKQGNTPLHEAIYSYNPLNQTVSCLIALGANTTIKNKKGKTPIEIAKNEYVKELLNPESVRQAQMPFYKEHVNKHHRNKKGNLFSLIHQRTHGIKQRIGM